MSFSLDFTRLIRYDAGLSGISFEISLKFDKKTIKVFTKIDTGSSDCVFSRKAAEEIGIKIEDGEKVYIGTVTGTFAAYRHPVILSAADFEFDVYAYFAEDENFNRSVLGRHGFFDRLTLGLVDYEGKLFLNRYELF
jgi:predicted aspartyl protease